MPSKTASFFHLHLVSDSTGETLITVARAAAAQYVTVHPVEHVYPAVPTTKAPARRVNQKQARPRAQRNRKRARRRSLHAARAGSDRAPRGEMPRSRPAVPVDS